MLGRGIAGLVVAAAAACGSGGAGDGSDAGSSGDDASLTDGAPPDAAGPRRLSDSKIFAQRGSNTMITFGLETEGPGTCLSEIVSGCEIQSCDTNATAVRASAGDVTLTTPLAEATYTPGDGDLYPSTPGVDWGVGDTIELTVAGDEVGGFSASLPGPGSVSAVSAPDLPGHVLVSRDEPLAVAWEGADAAVTAVVSCPTADALVQVRCRFPDGVMSSTMPAEALGRMPACENGNVYVLTEERILTGPDDLVVRFGARGPIISGTATVE